MCSFVRYLSKKRQDHVGLIIFPMKFKFLGKSNLANQNKLFLLRILIRKNVQCVLGSYSCCCFLMLKIILLLKRKNCDEPKQIFLRH